MTRVRDYNEVVQRLQKLPRGRWRVARVGEILGYPFFCVRRDIARDAPTVLLTGGMHGEEPAGVEAVLRWLESGQWMKWRVNWFALPCINPYGWERHQRTNAQRCDINRQFRNSSDCPEAELVKQLVRGKKFLFSIEFHEDVEASGYYLYELRREPPFIGEKIVKAVSAVVPINPSAVIDGNKATGRGLIRRDAGAYTFQKRRRWPMAFHLFSNCTGHVLGSETPVHVPLQKRAEAHMTALRTALKVSMR